MEKFLFKTDDYRIWITRDEDVYLYPFKETSDLSYTIKIIITRQEGSKDIHHCTYYKTFDSSENFNSLVYSSFIKKFLQDIEFRNTLECVGNPWDGTIKYSNENGVNLKCADKIIRLNSKENPKFKDFAELKTFGFDRYSKMKYEALCNLAGDKALAIIKEEFQDERLVVKALKWNVRGLSPQLSIRKVKADLLIAQNSEKQP